MIAIVLLVAAVLLAAYSISIFNRLQVLRNSAEAQLKQIRVAMQKRLDMITKLVDSVKSYASFEKDVLERVTRMRAEAMEASAGSLKDMENAASSILGKIRIAVENYPELKSSETVRELMESVQEVEDEIARQRYTYNNIVQEYNTRLSIFPSNLIASVFGFRRMEYLDFEPGNPQAEWKA